MRKSKIIFALFASFALLFASCASTSVSRVDANTVTDISEYWNDTDIRIVCETLINECVNSPRITKFTADNGKVPNVIIGRIRNDSSEFIDTSIVARKMQNAIINSGAMDFVSDSGDREELRAERLQQVDNASEESAKSIGNEIAADFMLVGSVKSVVQYDASGKKGVRSYFVYAQLQDLETTKIVWSGENDSIKKVIKRSGHKF